VLGPGSVINYRSVFLKDQMYVNLVPVTDVKLLTLDLETLLQLVAKHGEPNSAAIKKSESTVRAQKELIQRFSTRVLIAQNRMLKGEKAYPVDYIKCHPKEKE